MRIAEDTGIGDGADAAAAHTVWQVKASTLCNLRCGYCYEWDRLDDRARMTLAQWRLVLEAAADYRILRQRRHGVLSRVVVMWHGGEPTLLPAPYLKDVLALQREITARRHHEGTEFGNAVQTHLVNANPTLQAMIDAGFVVSASLDFGPGARVDKAGRETHERAFANLEGLLADGVRCGVTVVLGRHNQARLVDIHDRLDAIGAAWLRIVPMFAPPAGAPGAALALSDDDVVSALAGLFVHRVRHRARLTVYPLQAALQAVIGRRAEVAVPLRDRRRFGESRLVVHPDGTLAAEGGTGHPQSVLGNVFTQDADEIFGSAPYLESLRRDDELRAGHCVACRYRDACDSRPLFTYPNRFAPGPCPVDSRLMAVIDATFAA